jgi:hypothetical protein
LGEWDVRKAVVAGKLPRLIRYTNKMWDEARKAIWNEYSQGKNVTRWTMIMDMSKINAAQQVNPQGIHSPTSDNSKLSKSHANFSLFPFQEFHISLLHLLLTKGTFPTWAITFTS